MMNNLAQIEALLFVAGDEGITSQALCQITQFDKPAVIALIEQLANKYADDTMSALEVRETDGAYRLVTKPSLGGIVKNFFDAPDNATLSQAQLETFVIVAYKQPVTRVEIDQIRGVQSAGTLQKLMLRQLLVETGRKDEPGRPIMYGTSAMFLDYFGLKSLTELPPLPDFETLDVDDGGTLFANVLESENLEMKEGQKNV